jgi:hypothetical protein
VFETWLTFPLTPTNPFKVFGKPLQWKNKGVCHIVALPFTLKSILRRQKRNYENSNISPCKNIIFKKNHLKETQILQDIL